MQLHLVSEPEGQFQLSCVVLFLLAMLSSVSEPDISSSLAVLGLVAVALTNHNLMQLMVWMTPLSMIVDIVRMAINKSHNFIVFLDIMELVIKGGLTFLSHGLWRSFSNMNSLAAGAHQPLSMGANLRSPPDRQQSYAPPASHGGASYP